ncbi:MAG: glycoside hydrolase family 172 protein [Armatimonadota bacterium]
MLQFGRENMLRGLTIPRNVKARRVSSYATDGKNHDRWELEPNSTTTIADIQGPGCITHIWMTSGSDEPAWPRRVVIRIYWDDEQNPSVEVPMGDFFGCGHGLIRQWESVPMNTTGPDGRNRSAFNCWLPMPFNEAARIEIVNDSGEPRPLYFYIDYEERPQPHDEVLYFHSTWRRENPCDGWADPSISMGDPELNQKPNLSDEGNYLILQAEGRGTYIGCNLSIHNVWGGWWGEGDDMFFIDGEEWPPSLHGTGSEDYFSHAYGMQDVRGLYHGTSVYEDNHEEWKGKWTVYRWHLLDPIPFEESLRFSIEHGHANCRSDDYSSTAYWYQTEPHKSFETLPEVTDRLPNDVEE